MTRLKTYCRREIEAQEEVSMEEFPWLSDLLLFLLPLLFLRPYIGSITASSVPATMTILLMLLFIIATTSTVLGVAPPTPTPTPTPTPSRGIRMIKLYYCVPYYMS